MSGYLDLQVNGYGGVDFNGDDLTVDAALQACEKLMADGVAGILATVITDSLSNMRRRLQNIAAVVEASDTARQMIRGIHIEGPFISPEPGYVGAHPADCVQPATVDAMKQLLESANGLTRIVTLAPEADEGAAVTRMLADQGITVSGGHCNPSTAQFDAAIDAGLSMFTHLGNGCPLSLHRHDNIIQRVLSRSDKLLIGFIADGIHVPFDALKNYIAAAGLEHVVIVTDAISAAGLGPGTFELAGQQVIVDEAGATWVADRSHLVGSSITMPQVVHNLSEHLNFSSPQIQQVLVENPGKIVNGRSV